jgi:hypothetical protein
MNKKFVRFDEQLRARSELNQKAIYRTGMSLISAIDEAVSRDPAMNEKLRPLREYAQAGVSGLIVNPRTWAGEPLRYEFREFLLPKSVMDEYGEFAYHTHGCVPGQPQIHYFEGVAYVEVDE